MAYGVGVFRNAVCDSNNLRDSRNCDGCTRFRPARGVGGGVRRLRYRREVGDAVYDDIAIAWSFPLHEA